MQMVVVATHHAVVEQIGAYEPTQAITSAQKV